MTPNDNRAPLARVPSVEPRTNNEADPVTTEIVRNSLNSAANQMMRALVRTAFSPVIYDMMDFAVAIYDRDIRMMAQADGGLPVFMGTLSFCVAAAVEAVGGAGALEPGDVLIYNEPYGTGSHAQDVAIIMPAFHGGELVGYLANKAHNLDIGAKDPYCTDTTDVYQEGLVLPGVKLYRAGERAEDTFRILVANSRMPIALEGDLNAQVTCVRLGAELLSNLVARHGSALFWACVERIYDHGERLMRSFVEALPDGRYIGKNQLDDNGIDSDTIEFEVVVDIAGSSVVVDFSGAPDAQRGPINCPMPSTVSASRVAMAMLAGFNEPPNEGHFRVLQVITRPGSMYHPVRPQPCFSYGKATGAAVDAIIRALGQARPGLAPAGNNGDTCVVLVWGASTDKRDPWIFGCPVPSGQGGHDRGDGAVLYNPAVAFASLIPMEIDEAKAPVIYEKAEILPDLAGAGQFRGGTGWCRSFRLLEPGAMISWVDRTKSASWGLFGGVEGPVNSVRVIDAAGGTRAYSKATNVPLESGAVVVINVAGGGGYGPPERRSSELIRRDLAEGYISEQHARKYYPHVFSDHVGSVAAA